MSLALISQSRGNLCRWFLSSVKGLHEDFSGTPGPRLECGRPSLYKRGIDTHKTGFRAIEYRWHPWHGQRVLICGEARRSGRVILRCFQDQLRGFPALEVPEWMFDSHICSRVKPAEFPCVDYATLVVLQQLLSAVTQANELTVVQAQHHSSSSGDADADTVTVQSQSGRVVLSASEAAAVATGNASEGGPPAGPDTERTSAAPPTGSDGKPWQNWRLSPVLCGQIFVPQ